MFSNGYLATDAALSTNDWATNGSAAVDTWRRTTFSGYAQVITPESSYNKPYVGTKKANATYTVTIPSDAVGASIVFGKGANPSTSVNVKINNGTSDVVNEIIDLRRR